MSVEMINQIAGAILGATIAIVIAFVYKNFAADRDY
jgi:hypothetical protein